MIMYHLVMHALSGLQQVCSFCEKVIFLFILCKQCPVETTAFPIWSYVKFCLLMVAILNF
jgi:hypothetical protein